MPFLLLSLYSGLLAIDERAGWQSLLAHPVFSCAAIGAAFGRLELLLPVGFVLEIIWLSVLPMRGQRRPDVIAGSVVTAGLACLLLEKTGDPRWTFVATISILLGLVSAEIASPVVKRAHTFFRRRLATVSVGADESAERVVRRIERVHWSAGVTAGLIHFVVVLVLLLALYPVGVWLTGYTVLQEPAAWWRRFLPVLGCAALMHLFWYQHLKRVLILCALIVTLVLWMQ